MKLIDEMIEHLEEEIEGAREYAERYVECKARGNMTRANKYKEMASDELKHAEYVRDFALADVESLSHVYSMREEEKEKWDKAMRSAHEHMALTKHMLLM